MNADDRREFRDYAWKYFSLHADQRLKMFNFYIIFASLSIGAFSTLVGRGGFQKSYTLMLLLLSCLSFLFWKFENRTKILVKNGERALKYIDAQALDDHSSPLALFERDDEYVEALPRWPLARGYFSYARVFAWVYSIFGFGSVIGFMWCNFAY